MIFVAAGAVWLSIARFAIQFLWRDLASVQVPSLETWADWRRFLFGTNQLALNATRFGNLILLNLLMCLIVAVAVARLRRPRPPIRELFRQPGFVACVSPFPAMLCCLVLSFAGLPQVVYSTILGSAAPLSWVVLIVTRKWRAEPGWIDRLGRIVGVAFMVSSIAHLIFVSLPL